MREAVGIEREALAIRAGLDAEFVARTETGERPLDGGLLDTLLLVLGYEPVREAEGTPAAARRPLDRYGAEQLAYAAASPAGERLGRALEWNQFAAELAARAARQGLSGDAAVPSAAPTSARP